MFSVITNIYNKHTKGHSLMELFTATGKLKTEKVLACICLSRRLFQCDLATATEKNRDVIPSGIDTCMM